MYSYVYRMYVCMTIPSGNRLSDVTVFFPVSFLKSAKARLKVRMEELKKLEWEHEVLKQRFEQTQNERDELYGKFVKAIHEVQQKSNFKNLLLEKKLAALADTLEKKVCCLFTSKATYSLHERNRSFCILIVHHPDQCLLAVLGLYLSYWLKIECACLECHLPQVSHLRLDMAQNLSGLEKTGNIVAQHLLCSCCTYISCCGYTCRLCRSINTVDTARKSGNIS